MMEVVEYHGNVELLRPIGEEWHKAIKKNIFGLTGNVDKFLNSLDTMIKKSRKVLFALISDGEPVGVLAMEVNVSPVSDDLYAHECFWFVMEEHRGVSSLRMLKAAEKWARKAGCTHFMMVASERAFCNTFDGADRVGNLYERFGMNKLETSYAKRL